jgi:hypothetical protein
MYMINTLLDDYNKKYTRKRKNSLGCLKELNKTSIENTMIRLEDCKENLLIYKRRFNVITTLKYGEKLGKDQDGNYNIFHNGYFQQMTRWWYTENRYKTFDYIEKDLDEFTKYLETYYNNILMSDGFKYSRIAKDPPFMKIATFNDDLNFFIKQMVTGVYTLKKTYTNNVENASIFGTKIGDAKAKEIVRYIDHKIARMLYYKNMFLQMCK